MPDIQTCVFLSQRNHDDSPPSVAAEVVYETLILPVMENFPGFVMNPRGYIHEPGSISNQLLEELLSADLVIADLTELSPSGYYELGVRHSSSLPTVLIAEEDFVMAIDAVEFRLVRYPFQRSPSTAGDQETIDRLAAAIRDALDIQPRTSGTSLAPTKLTPQERRVELAKRIDEAAEVIGLLRINSTGEAVAELHEIAEELRDVQDEIISSALKESANAVLAVLSRIVDQLATVRGSRMAISGAIALVVGGAGWPAVTALGIALAYWEGKEAFLKALSAIAGKK